MKKRVQNKQAHFTYTPTHTQSRNEIIATYKKNMTCIHSDVQHIYIIIHIFIHSITCAHTHISHFIHTPKENGIYLISKSADNAGQQWISIYRFLFCYFCLFCSHSLSLTNSLTISHFSHRIDKDGEKFATDMNLTLFWLARWQ